jgi:hypothetical protein
MFILGIALVVSLFVMGAAGYVIYTRQPEKQPGELLRLSETAFTAVMGIMLILLALALLVMKFLDDTLGGAALDSYIFVGVFAVLSAAGGSLIMMYTFLRKIIAGRDGITFVSMFGNTKEMAWKDIIEVKANPLSSKITLITENDRLTVGGEQKTYKRFLNIARNRIRREVVGDLIDKQIGRFLF